MTDMFILAILKSRPTPNNFRIWKIQTLNKYKHELNDLIGYVSYIRKQYDNMYKLRDSYNNVEEVIKSHCWIAITDMFEDRFIKNYDIVMDRIKDIQDDIKTIEKLTISNNWSDFVELTLDSMRDFNNGYIYCGSLIKNLIFYRRRIQSMPLTQIMQQKSISLKKIE